MGFPPPKTPIGRQYSPDFVTSRRQGCPSFPRRLPFRPPSPCWWRFLFLFFPSFPYSCLSFLWCINRIDKNVEHKESTHGGLQLPGRCFRIAWLWPQLPRKLLLTGYLSRHFFFPVCFHGNCTSKVNLEYMQENFPWISN